MLAGLMDTGDGSEFIGHDGRIDPADQRPLMTPIDRSAPHRPPRDSMLAR